MIWSYYCPHTPPKLSYSVCHTDQQLHCHSVQQLCTVTLSNIHCHSHTVLSYLHTVSHTFILSYCPAVTYYNSLSHTVILSSSLTVTLSYCTSLTITLSSFLAVLLSPCHILWICHIPVIILLHKYNVHSYNMHYIISYRYVCHYPDSLAKLLENTLCVTSLCYTTYRVFLAIYPVFSCLIQR